MGKRTKLYLTLLEMLDAAQENNQERVIAINAGFSREYSRIMPSNYNKDSMAGCYDMARNKLINSVDDMVASTTRRKNKQLREAKNLISKIKEYEHY
jgi:hypothetical protein